MTEQKVKKRGWIKNVAIIFLAALLVLTFFSNTIMNRSLPEVATQTVASGVLSTQIRGTGAVTAEESFEVKTTQSRTVLSVPVRLGDKVSIGDTLLIFSTADSAELKEAQDALDALVLAYQKALVNASSGQYSAERRAVQDAQDALVEAKAKRDANAVTDAELLEAQVAVDNAQTQYNVCEIARDNAQNALDALGGLKEGSTGDYSAVTAAQTKLIAAQNNRDATELLYKNEFTAFNNTVNAQHGTTSVAVYSEYLAMEYSRYENSTNPNEQQLYAQAAAYYAIQAARAAYDAALTAYNAALKAYNEANSGGNATQYNRLNAELTAAKNALAAAEKSLKTAQDKLDKLKAKKTAYDEAVAAVTAAQKSVQTALFSLEKSMALENLDFAEMKKKIDEQNKTLDELKNGGGESVIKSQVNGIVSSINITAGNKATPDSPLMTVEVPDRGYILSFAVTTEQSQKVRVGDMAEVMYNYWGANISANLAAIRSDPSNPGKSKMLVFKLSGSVESGSQLTLAIGERGQAYEAIVPTSAVRSDSNGNFVLIVEAKSSPLGNRYKAARVDVKTLASDDKYTAISGGIAPGDYVITSSSAPLTPGMLVRLPDSN